MTTRNLDALFKPRAIVLVGASNQTGSVGHVLSRNLLSAGFGGLIMPVNPHESEICGRPSYVSLAQLPATPDLAVIATPPAPVPGLVQELGALGCRAAVVITAGFDATLRTQLLQAAQPHLMRIVGPNCLGFLSPAHGVNASFAHLMPPSGNLAFITQSGAIATAIIDWAAGKDIGFSHIVSLGDMSDVDIGDLLDFLALDAATHAILIYAEGITQARKFMSAARIASRLKPVIIVKGGRSQAGARAAASHTGALAGSDSVYDAAFRRAGMLRVPALRDLFDAAETLSAGFRVNGDRLIILTNGGGLGVLAADALEAGGGRLAALPEGTREQLSAVLPSAWSHSNPIDVLGDAQGDRYEAALNVLTDHSDCDAILVMNCPTGVADSLDGAEAVVRARTQHPRMPILACWTGEATAAASRAFLSKEHIPNYETPDEAVGAFLRLAEYTRNQRALFETPIAPLTKASVRVDEARAVVETVVAEGRETLTEPEAKRVLAAFGVPIVETRSVSSPAEAGAAARAIGGPVALKILSRQISHKTDVGGVCLDLEGESAVVKAAEDMLTRVGQMRPDALIDGFTVQQIIKRPRSQELLLGIANDATFGPCLLFGHGGVAAEVIADRVIGLPPLNRTLALDMIGRTRVSQLLRAWRDRPEAQIDKVADTLVALSDMLIALPQIAELDINPLLADADGVIALDARIIVRPAAKENARLAIRPYPDELVKTVTVDDMSLTIRPIRPEDGSRLIEFARRTSSNDLRLRFHGARAALNAQTAARLSQIDYDREMVLLAVSPADEATGVVRLVFDPDFASAECAIIVRSDLQRQGIGRMLLQEILAYARVRGATCVWGDILAENQEAIDLARHVGASEAVAYGDPHLTRVAFDLT